MDASLFQRLGGDAGVQAIVDDFIDRTVSDLMIGFYFRSADIDRIKRLEAQLAAGFLGAPQPYGGRPLTTAHAPHRIFEGHFFRRIEILRETLDAHDVATDIRDAWIAHNLDLRDQVVGTEPCHGPGGSP